MAAICHPSSIEICKTAAEAAARCIETRKVKLHYTAVTLKAIAAAD